MSKAVVITKENFSKEVLESETPVILDLWAEWCGPCKMIGPILDRLAGEYGGAVKVGKINVDEQEELAAQFNVRSIPMLVAMSKGDVVDTSIGFRGEGPLREMFDRVSSK